MNINISTKNFNASDTLRKTIETKLSRLDKYFTGESETNVTLSNEGGRQTIEATITADGGVFRAEETTQEKDLYNSIDRLVDKLSGQIGKYKSKVTYHHKDNKSDRFVEV